MPTPEQQLVKQRINATDDDIELFVLRLEKFLGKNLRGILKGIDTGSNNALNAASILGNIRSALEAAGLKDEIAAIDKIYGKQLDLVAQTFKEVKEAGQIYSEADVKTVEALINFDESVIANKVYQITDSLSSTVMRQVISGAKIDVNSLVDDFGGTTANQIKAELNTATAGFYTSITQAKAKELDVDFFAYVGPDDAITRPFCDERVGKIFTRAQIAKWDNGTKLPADIYRGGYNCRHALVPMSKERAEQRVSEGTYAWG